MQRICDGLSPFESWLYLPLCDLRQVTESVCASVSSSVPWGWQFVKQIGPGPSPMGLPPDALFLPCKFTIRWDMELSHDPQTRIWGPSQGLWDRPQRPFLLLLVFLLPSRSGACVFMPRVTWLTLKAPHAFCQPWASASHHLPGLCSWPCQAPPTCSG